MTSRLSLMSNLADGRDRSGEFLLVDVWTRSGSAWKLAARFSSPAEKTSE